MLACCNDIFFFFFYLALNFCFLLNIPEHSSIVNLRVCLRNLFNLYLPAELSKTCTLLLVRYDSICQKHPFKCRHGIGFLAVAMRNVFENQAQRSRNACFEYGTGFCLSTNRRIRIYCQVLSLKLLFNPPHRITPEIIMKSQTLAP